MPRMSESARQTLEIVAENQVEIFSRLAAPKELTDEQREEFVQVVNSVPADNLVPANLGLLVQYCRHRVMARRVAEKLEDALAAGRGDHVEALAKAQARESKILGYLATGLRLTPQAVYLGRKVATARAISVQNPWDKPPRNGG